MELLAFCGSLIGALLIAVIHFARREAVAEVETELEVAKQNLEAAYVAKKVRADVDQLPDDELQRRVLLNAR